MKPLSQILSAVCIIIVFALQVQAQDSPANPTTIVTQDSLITVIPWRSMNEINAAIDNAKNLLSQAEAKRMLAQSSLSYTDTRIDLKKKEIDLIDKRIDIADDAKKEPEVASLKSEMQVAKKMLDILKTQKSVREAEVEAANAEYDYAGALQIALEMELQLGKRRAEHATTASAGEVQQLSINQMVGELISKTLDAQLEAAKKEQKYSDRKRDLTAQRAKLHELQKDFTTGSK
jgi:hypothetical protein